MFRQRGTLSKDGMIAGVLGVENSQRVAVKALLRGLGQLADVCWDSESKHGIVRGGSGRMMYAKSALACIASCTLKKRRQRLCKALPGGKRANVIDLQLDVSG